MPLVLILALAGSLALHGVALFGTDVELFGGGAEPVPLQAELKPPPPPPEAAKTLARPAVKHARARPPAHHPATPATPAKAVDTSSPTQPNVTEPSPESETAAASGSEAASPVRPASAPAAPAKPVLAAQGVLRFAIFKESLGLQVGRAEHRWEFSEDGHYRLTGVTETSGLAALFKPMRFEVVSEGRLVAGGLQPEHLRSTKNGQDSNENADFDWASGSVSLSRDGSRRDIAPGSQDILSLNYQLAYLGKLAEGSNIGVVTGKKYERYALDSLGEEQLDTPAGRFRTLHLRALTDSTTEIWIALDHQRLPVKIRFTDKKGESFEQVLTEIGSAAETSR
jgi:hypothetical protein